METRWVGISVGLSRIESKRLDILDFDAMLRQSLSVSGEPGEGVVRVRRVCSSVRSASCSSELRRWVCN